MSGAGVAAQLRAGGVDLWLVEAIQRLARAKERSLDPYLVSVGDSAVVADTQTTCRCHFVRLDPHGRPRVAALVKMLAAQVVDYCIPRSRVDEAQDHLLRTGSTEKILQLQGEARQLFTKIKTSGEGGELLLYTLLEITLGLPQVLCKMSLKTNPQVHYHGVDGVHAKALANGNLAVYWGEAKLYKDVKAAIDAAFTSLAPLLLDPGGGAAERDVLLLRDNADTGDEQLTEALIRYFTDDTPEASRLEVRGACLVGFSVSNYPDPFEDGRQSIREEVAAAMQEWRAHLGAAVATQALAAFEIEVFCVPLPSVQHFRDALLKELGLAP